MKEKTRNSLSSEQDKKRIIGREEFKQAMDHFKPLSDYSIGYGVLNLVLSLSKDKDGIGKIFYATLMYFKLGYIQGLRHARDKGLEEQADSQFTRNIDVNKFITELEQVDIFKTIFNFEPLDEYYNQEQENIKGDI